MSETPPFVATLEIVFVNPDGKPTMVNRWLPLGFPLSGLESSRLMNILGDVANDAICRLIDEVSWKPEGWGVET